MPPRSHSIYIVRIHNERNDTEEWINLYEDQNELPTLSWKTVQQKYYKQCIGDMLPEAVAGVTIGYASEGFNLGDEIDALSSDQVWGKAIVISFGVPNMIRIRYEEYDLEEWINLEEDRHLVSPLGTHQHEYSSEE
jgi:hypothetical protein